MGVNRYGHIVITGERWWFLIPLKLLHLIRYPWAQKLAYFDVARRVVAMDATTGTITVDHPFPKSVKPGVKIVHKLEE